MSENCRKCAGRLVAAKLQTLTELARLARFERATAWFVARGTTRSNNLPIDSAQLIGRKELVMVIVHRATLSLSEPPRKSAHKP